MEPERSRKDARPDRLFEQAGGCVLGRLYGGAFSAPRRHGARCREYLRRRPFCRHLMSNLTGYGRRAISAASQRAPIKSAACEPSAILQRGLAGNVLGGTMLAGPLGEAAQGLRAAPYISELPGWLASRVAGGTVGAGSSAAGAYGRGDHITMPTLVGGALGTVIGAPAGGRQAAGQPSAQSYFDPGDDRNTSRSATSSTTPRARFIRRSTSRTPKTPSETGAATSGTTRSKTSERNQDPAR